jgi:CHAD domain-containing protein
MDFIEAHFKDEVRNFSRLLRAQAKSLTLEGVHDLRVCTRRLRAQIQLIEKSSTHHFLVKAEDTLKNLGHALGERRQWDVALEGAHKYHLKDGKLRADQKDAGAKLRKALHSAEVKALPKQLAAFERTLKNEKIQIQEKQLKKMRSQLKTWLNQKKFSPKDLHELRISTKKIRYAFECMDLPVEDLKDLQDHLGKSHDLTVLSEYFDQPKSVRKADHKERRHAKKRIRPALSSSLEVLDLLR